MSKPAIYSYMGRRLELIEWVDFSFEEVFPYIFRGLFLF